MYPAAAMQMEARTSNKKDFQKALSPHILHVVLYKRKAE